MDPEGLRVGAIGWLWPASAVGVCSGPRVPGREVVPVREGVFGQVQVGFPAGVRGVVEVTPLYRGVVLCRELTTGALSWASAVSVVYLVAMGVIGVMVVRRRLATLLLT